MILKLILLKLKSKMGIPFYFYYLCRKYKSHNIVFNDFNENKIPDYLYFDYNSLIHPCIQSVLQNLDENLQLSNEELENIFIEKCLDYTQDIIYRISPKERISIVIDGVAPKAKMNQQRERRYKSIFLNKKKWDTNQITPGTPFMKRLNERLNKLAQNSNGKIIISDSTEIGEGEHKIMKMISEVNDYSKIHCIYGLDADLIMLSLVNSKRSQIYLFRDNTKLTEENHGRFQYLNIDLLSRFLVYDIMSYTEFFEKEVFYNFSNIIIDYIFLCFMFGNDFLPHLPCLTIKNNGVDSMIRAYTNSLMKFNQIQLDTFLVNSSQIYYENIRFGNIINLEFLFDVLSQFNNPEDIITHKLLDEIPDIDNVFFYKENYFHKESYFYTKTKQQTIKRKTRMDVLKHRYYTYYNMYNNIEDSVLNYLEGMFWTLGYYFNHSHNNWRWYYKYNEAPLMKDVLNVMEYEIKGIQNEIRNITIKKTSSYNEKEQLLLVLPLESLERIKERNKENNWLKNLDIIKNTKDFKDYYPTILFLDCSNVEYIWQAKPILKHISDEFLSSII